MAGNDKLFVVKNGLRTQNTEYLSPDRTNTITLEMLDSDTLSWEGDSGQLFSITDSLSGTIFSVNDISGIPSIEVDDDGTIRLAEFAGNVLVGTNTDDGTNKLQVSGSATATSFVGPLTGNASTASTLETPRTITLSGAVTGSTTFDGSSNVTISTTATNDPTLTLSGDASGSATFTNLGNATLTVSVDGGNADTLDNQNGTYYLDYNNFTNKPSLYNSSDFDTDFASKTTDNLSEGSNNLYYTNARVRSTLSGGTGISYSSTTGTISIDGSVVTESGSQVLTNKTFDLTNNTLSATLSELNSSVSDATLIVEAPNDGNAYIRQNGQWVDINNIVYSSSTATPL